MKIDITKSEVLEKIQEETYSLNDLINPTDVDEMADSWEDIEESKIKQEITQSITVMKEENWYPYPSNELHIGYVEDYMYKIWREKLRRLPRDAFKDDISDKELLVKYWVWPNKMDKWQITDLMYEYGDIPNEVENEGLEVLAKGYEKALNPIE